MLCIDVNSKTIQIQSSCFLFDLGKQTVDPLLRFLLTPLSAQVNGARARRSNTKGRKLSDTKTGNFIDNEGLCEQTDDRMINNLLPPTFTTTAQWSKFFWVHFICM